MISVRQSVFETNSSSTHSVTICNESDYERWKRGEILFAPYENRFVENLPLSPVEQKKAKQDYKEQSNMFWKPWDVLTKDEQSQWYKNWSATHKYHGNYETFDEYYRHDLNYFDESFVSQSGDKIVVFGRYGYDG